MGLIMFKWNKMPVYFDGHDISSVMNITNLNRGIGTSRKNSLLKAGNQKGTQYKNYTYDEKVIPMSFSLNGDLISKRREVAKLLSVNEPKRLIFGDEPDKYYLAVPDGDIDLDEAAAVGKGVINWIIPDGVAHSINTQLFESDIEKPGEIKVFNNGSEKAKPIIRVTMKSENGFVGLIDNDGNIIQIGDPTELDERHYKQTDKVLWEMMRANGQWQHNKGSIVYPNYLNNPATPNKIEGTWKFGPPNPEEAMPQFTGNSQKVWAGPTLYQPIKPNSNGDNFGNFECRFRFYLANSIKTVGRAQFQLTAGTSIPFAFVLRDSHDKSNQMNVEFWIYGKKIDDIELDMKKIGNGYFYEGVIIKYGDTVNFTMNKILKFDPNKPETIISAYAITRSYTMPGLSTQVIDGITQWLAIWKPWPAPSLIAFTDTKFWWLNVDKTENVPNSFDPGDELLIDTAKGLIYVNGVQRDDLNNVGNRWSSFGINPGASYIFTTESDWVTEKPHYEVLFGEVWL